MKTELPPWAVAAIVVVVLLIVVVFFFYGTGSARHAQEMEDAINATAARASAKTPAPTTSGGAPGGPGAPAPQTK